MIPATNRLDDVQKWLSSELQPGDGRENHQMVRILMEDLLGLSKEQLMLGEKRIGESQIQILQSAISRLNNNEPIQYVSGVSFFHELKLKIDSRALIPRPETEELVELSLTHLKGGATIMDICSGSGCIALALKNMLPKSTVYGLEKSEEAIELSKENADYTGLDVTWLNEDVFSDDWTNQYSEKLDLIVSNPPYIPYSDQKEMAENVLMHEPSMALFVENHEPLVFYERLANLSQTLLKTGGSLVCEIHESMANEAMDLFSKKGLKFVEVHQDLQGKNRMVCGKK